MRIRNQLGSRLISRCRESKFWLEFLAIALFFIAFAPVSQWFAENAFSETRVFHSLITLILAIILLFRHQRPKIIDGFSLNANCRKCCLLAFVLLAFFFLAKYSIALAQINNPLLYALVNLSVIAAMTFSATSLIFFIFGTEIARIAYSSSLTFILFLFLSLFMIHLDWPLRTLAAQWSVLIIEFLGQNVQIFLTNYVQDSPNIIIQYDEHNFNVASECNGFGIILNGALVGLLLSVYKGHHFLNGLIQLSAALFIGFSFNILRIISIILVAPPFFEYYDLLHELLGTLYYWGAFFVTWYLLKGPLTKVRENGDQAVAS